MLCQACKKNPATTHITQMVKGEEKQEIHLCEACAKEQGVALKPPLLFGELLANFIDPHLADPEQLKMVCSTCGITYADFREVGRLGCPDDYDRFKKNLIHLLDRIHHATQHVGKVPSGAGPAVAEQARLKDLAAQLKTAVRVEDYERAAQIRDEIAEIKQQEGTK